jgi:hypothetical protein
MNTARPLLSRALPLLLIVASCYDPEPPESSATVGVDTKVDQLEGSSGASGCTADDECDDEQVCLVEGGECVADETGRVCDPGLQDCGTGFKCNPWADDGGSTWNANQCVPVLADAHEVGESCRNTGGGTSGFDDCAGGSACIDGTCMELCGGDADSPVCEGERTQCRIYNDGALRLCEGACDALAQDCAQGSGCYYSDGGFACHPEGEADEGELCETLNSCEAGLACMAASAVPCTGEYCCTGFCEVGGAATCPDGLACTALFNPGNAPDGADALGVCAS